MKTLVLGTIASLGLSVALVAAQTQTPPPTQQTPPPTQQQQQPPPTPPAVPALRTDQKIADVELTGCLVQGSGPTVFIFENAKTEDQPEAEKGRTYLLISGADKVEFTPHLNKKVRISGSVEKMAMTPPPTPTPAGQKVAEKDLPRLTARTVTHIADTCALLGSN
jgi:uncharacterized protein YdeI (BOF family)